MRQESDDSMSFEKRAAMMAQSEDAKQQLAKIDVMIKEQRSRMALISEFMRQLSQDQKWIDLFSRMGFPAPPPSNGPLSWVISMISITKGLIFLVFRNRNIVGLCHGT